MAERRERRERRKRQNEQEPSAKKEYKVIVQLLVCIVLMIAFVMTQGMDIQENMTVRDCVKNQVSQTTNLKETVQYVQQRVEPWLREKQEEGAAVSSSEPTTEEVQADTVTP